MKRLTVYVDPAVREAVRAALDQTPLATWIIVRDAEEPLGWAMLTGEAPSVGPAANVEAVYRATEEARGVPPAVRRKSPAAEHQAKLPTKVKRS